MGARDGAHDNGPMTVPSIASEPPGSADRPGWTVIVPVKSTSRGKSRIAVDPEVRRQLAIALATDTVSAVASATAVMRVLVVADDADDAAMLTAVAKVDVRLTDATSLNEAILDGRSLVSGPVAVLPGDLPSLTGAELDAALGAVDRPVMVVADRQGIGTTLLAALVPADLVPRYGPDSYRRHRDAGAEPLALPVDSGVRRDVDTVEDLADVHGCRTARVASALLDRAGRGPARVGRAC